MENVTITAAFNKYFGRQPGQNMSDFSAEIKKAIENPKDRADWVAMFATVGFNVTQ